MILKQHYDEWLASAIAPSLIEANCYSLTVDPYGARDEAILFLYQPEEIPRRNGGHAAHAFLWRHNYLNRGGWVSVGYNLLTGKRSQWGTLKPDTPRWDRDKNRPRKYEHPRNRPTEIHVPGIPLEIAERWLGKYECWPEFRDNYAGEELFTAWAFMLSHPEVPLNITEGNKKTNCLVTHQGMTIGLAGVWNWIDPQAPRFYGDNRSSYREKTITPLLRPLLCQGREVNLWFDEDNQSKTRQNVDTALLALGNAIAAYGAQVRIACWNADQGKGVDDAIRQHSPHFLHQIQWYSIEAYPHQQLIETQKKLHSLTYPVNLPLDTSCLPDLSHLIPKSGIINLKSAKASGKSFQMQKLCKHWKAQGKHVISLTPRIALGRRQAAEWEIHWIDELGRIHQEISLGLCWDSLQKVSHLDWQKYVIVIDECELGIEHLLCSSTCKNRRSLLLKIFQEKIPECLHNGGTVVLSDADLTDISVDYLNALAPSIPIFTIVNEALPKSWRITFQTGKIDETLEQLFTDLEEGVKVAVATDSQTEAEALHWEINQRLPLCRVDRVDGKTCQQEYGKAWVNDPNRSLERNRPDVLIYTPSMGVGVSIVTDWFEVVYGLFHGILAPSQCRQMLARVRTLVPRKVWCRQKGLISKEEGSFYPEIIKSNLAFNLRDELSLLDLISAIAPDTENLEEIYRVLSAIRNEGKWDNPHLETYAKLKARRNYGLSQLALQLRQELTEEGHDLLDLIVADGTGSGGALQAGKQALKEQEASGIARVQEISIEQARDLSYQSSLTEEERHQMTKAFILEELPEAELTPDFVLSAIVRDRRKWLNATKLFWYLHNPEIAKSLDQRNWLHYGREFARGTIYLPDVKGYTAKIQLLRDLRLLELLKLDHPNQTFSNHDTEVLAFYRRCYQERDRLKRLMGITFSRKLSPIQLLRMLAERIGLALCGKQIREGKHRKRIYWINQEKLFAPHRLEVLKALDRRGEAIARKAQTVSHSSCHTPALKVNPIGGSRDGPKRRDVAKRPPFGHRVGTDNQRSRSSFPL